ncbi:hypothetical protein TNCV_698711 [Trichonephila clavipes]|nr:hypothetical protein TNCV_698711 [Trichonephila clavipes]
MILCVAELLERLKKGENNRCCQGVQHRSQRCFTAVKKSFKTTEMCSRRHGRGRVSNTTPAIKTDISSYQQKGKRDEALLPHVRLFRGALGDKFVFMDDNATCHRTLAVQDCLDSEGIQRLVWPAFSNRPLKMLGCFGRQVAGRNYPPTNKNTLIRALTEEWDKLPQHPE